LILGWAALRTRRLGLAIMIHIGFNATGLALVL
jgi:membrane protease YdiL (CAAX protease family)